MDDHGPHRVEQYDETTEAQAPNKIGRRSYLKLAGVTAAGITTVTIESGVAQATSDGYGEGGYGEGPYGGEDGLSVATKDVTDLQTTSTTLNGSLDDLGGADSADCYFEWRRSGASSWNVTTVQTLSSTGSYSESLSGLEDGVEYEYRAIGEASDGDTATGSTLTFTTTDDPPAVTTKSASNITDTSVTLNGSLDDLGSASAADAYFKWRQVGASTWNKTGAQTLSSTASFDEDLSGIDSGTDYEYEAVAEASDGDTATGSTVTFTTESSNTAPTIDSYSVTEAGSPNPHVEITADWSVSDADGNLDTVVVEVFNSSGSLVDSAMTNVNGSSASGTDSFKIKQAEDTSYDVKLTVTDTKNSSNSETKTITG